LLFLGQYQPLIIENIPKMFFSSFLNRIARFIEEEKVEERQFGLRFLMLDLSGM